MSRYSIGAHYRARTRCENNPHNGKLTKLCYGNGFAVRYEYNELDNITEIWYTVPVRNSDGTVTYQETQACGYTYTAYGQLYRFDNLRTGKSIIYKYDTAGKMTSFVEFDTEDMTNEFSSTMFYNEEGKLDSLFYTLDYSSPAGITDHDVFYFTSYEPDGSLSSYSVDTDVTRGDIDYAYDAFKRLESKTYDFHVVGNAASRFTNTTHYEYSHNGNSTSAQISEFSSAVGTNGTLTSTYTYDDYGNITKIHLSDGTEYRYVYDNLGQLIREDNTALNKTYVYTYDNAGNILRKETYALTAAGITPSGTHSTVYYSYNDPEWGDLLTSYNGQTITYDGIGNPLTLNGYTLTWEGRRLTGMTMNGGQFGSTYEYNDDGIRISKTVSGVRHDYYLDGAQIEAEAWGNNLCIYLYDAEGAPIGLQYRTASMPEGQFYTFWFEKNLQGDVIAVYTENGTKIGSYTYDAWGNCTVSTESGTTTIQKQIVRTLNPFRYRGYYLDTETGLYYLQTRYYDPAAGRFLSADSYVNANGDLIGFNMYAYCSNNSINGQDPTGQMVIVPPSVALPGLGRVSPDTALYLFLHWLFGNGQTLTFDESSTIASKFKGSPQMNEICQNALEDYKRNGVSHSSGSASISGFNEFDLWMGVRGFSYSIDITEKQYTEGFWFWKKTKTEYTLSIIITDVYDFNSGVESGNGIGSILNNMAYNLHTKGVGTDYAWSINYQKKYNSPKKHNRINLLSIY